MKSYVIAGVATAADAADARLARLRATAEAAGMTVVTLSPQAWLAVGGAKTAPTVSVGAWTLVGDVFHRNAPPVGRVADQDPHVYEKKMIARFWGRYIGFRLGPDGCLAAVVRDTSGALDCMTWTTDGLTLVASDLPAWLPPVHRKDWRINGARLEAALHDPYGTAGALLLDGPAAVLPGTLQPLPDGPAVSLWRPDWLARSAPARSDAEAAATLRDAVDEAVAGFAAPTDPSLAKSPAAWTPASSLRPCSRQDTTGRPSGSTPGARIPRPTSGPGSHRSQSTWPYRPPPYPGPWGM